MAITSFIPAVCSDFKIGDDDLGTKAITALIKFAIQFSELANHPMVLQLVSGSAIRSVDFKAGAKIKFRVNTIDQDVAYQHTLDRLAFCFDQVAPANLKRLRIAMELEPGPLFLLRDRETLTDFCDAVDDHPSQAVRERVGLNLDIAHWCLADITTEWIQDKPTIKSKIFHSHISGHSRRGHFGDFSLEQLDDELKKDYKQWLRFLAKDLDALKGFSGTTSVEYEVSKNTDMVSESVEELVRWIDEMEKPEPSAVPNAPENLNPSASN